MRFYTAPGILLIVSIVDFALAAPVLVQEKRQASTDMADIPKYPVNVLGRRGEIEEVGGKYIENWFTKPESSAAHPLSGSPQSGSDAASGWVDVKHPQLSSPEGLSPVSNPRVVHPPPPKLGTFDYMAVEEPPSRPASPFVSEANHGYQMVHPPPPPTLPGSASLTEPGYEVVDVPPPSTSKSSTKPNRRSMGEDSRLENLQAVSDTLQGDVQESRRLSGIARDVLNAAQRDSQRVRSLGPGE